MKGKLIVFEGLDKSGKETQAKLLLKHLSKRNIDAVYLEEPSPNNPVGRLIKDFLGRGIDISSGKSIALLYTADRYEQLMREILPAIESGKTVLLDRYYYSTIAYEKVIYGVDEAWIRELNRYAMKPDLVIFMDIEPEESMARASRMKESDRLEKLEFQKSVHAAYHEMLEKESFLVVDGRGTVDEVQRSVVEAVEKALGL